MVRKLIAWGLGLFVIFYLFTDPTGAAALVHRTLGILHSAAVSMATFVHSL